MKQGHMIVPFIVAMLLAGCSGGSEFTDENAAAYLSAVRDAVPGAVAYSDDQLLDMAEEVCAAGNTERGAEVLESSDQIASADRERLAYLALTAACPYESGSGY